MRENLKLPNDDVLAIVLLMMQQFHPDACIALFEGYLDPMLQRMFCYHMSVSDLQRVTCYETDCVYNPQRKLTPKLQKNCKYLTNFVRQNRWPITQGSIRGRY